MKKIMRAWRIDRELFKRLLEAAKVHSKDQTAFVERGLELAIREADKKSNNART